MVSGLRRWVVLLLIVAASVEHVTYIFPYDDPWHAVEVYGAGILFGLALYLGWKPSIPRWVLGLFGLFLFVEALGRFLYWLQPWG